MENKGYVMSSVEEYFEILDREDVERKLMLVELFAPYLR